MHSLNKESGFTRLTPLAMMTLGDFLAALEEQGFVSKSNNQKPAEKRYVYGLRGIRELFNVSTKTAQTWKDTILKEAVYQSGRTIVTDVDKALELFDKRRAQYGTK